MTHSTRLSRAIVCAALTALLGAACTEPRQTGAAATPAPSSELRLVVAEQSPKVGDTVHVSVVALGFDAQPVGSYTLRMRYDTTALRFAGETARQDRALRASNAERGYLRAAGAAAAGFGDGKLATFTFVALRGASPVTIALEVLELHRIDHVDASRELKVSGTPALAP